MNIWRISNHLSLSGEGGRRVSGRWHTVGRPVVYASASSPGALLEVLVHLRGRFSETPEGYTLLRINVPNDLDIETLTTAPLAWNAEVLPSRFTGDAWLANRKTALAKVPSVVIPYAWNYLMNPLHPSACDITITSATEERLDPRLTGLLR